MSTLKRWTGTAWETIDSGAKVVGGMGGQLISEQVLTADVSSVTFSNLNSLTDGDYTLECSIINPRADLAFYNLTANNHTSSNYNGAGILTYSDGSSLVNDIGSRFGVGDAGATAQAILKITVVGGYVSMLVQGMRGGTSPTLGSIFKALKSNVTLSSITSLTVNAVKSDGTTIHTALGVGSSFRLYGSKLATNLISYDPINHTNFTADRLLKAGEVAYIDYTNATSVPLHVQTEEGLYEMEIFNDYVTASGGSYNELKPNNVNTGVNTVSNAYEFYGFSSSGGGTTPSTNFRIGSGKLLQATARIVTRTGGKMVCCNPLGREASGLIAYVYDGVWTESTPWVSLGTMAFGEPQSGKIVIKRII
jgi:hypothetical protein